jgi:putative heme iron utilization protein
MSLDAKGDLVRSAAQLIDRCRVAALATLHQGLPSVSMVPYAFLGDPLVFIVLVSELAAHTREMLKEPRIALMIVQPESSTTLPHALARVAMRGRAEKLSRDDPLFNPARTAYAARFPEMADLFGLGDFALFTIKPASMRVVAGFARAATLRPDAVDRAMRCDTPTE